MSEEWDDEKWEAYYKEADAYFEALDYACDKIPTTQDRYDRPPHRTNLPKATVVRPKFKSNEFVYWRQALIYLGLASVILHLVFLAFLVWLVCC